MLTHIYLNNTYFLPTHIQVKWKILSFVISSSCFIVLHLNFQIETENVIFAIIETVHKTVILISLLWSNQHIQSINDDTNEKYQFAKWKVVIDIKLSIIEIMIEACKFSWFQMIHFVSSCSKPWAVFNHFVFCDWYFGEIKKIYRYLQDQQKYSINDRVLKIRRVDKPHALIV